MTWSVKQLPDLAGKVVIITGANCGLGLESAKQLGAKGAHVVMACRNPKRGEEALKAVKAVAKGPAELMQLDLASLASVRAFAGAFKSKGLPLHVLLNSAGVMMCPFSKTEDGIEMQFGTNHVGHFLLTNLLMDVLKSSAPSRIVNLSSSLHEKCPKDGIKFDDLEWRGGKDYDITVAYGHSKFANILFTRELARRLEGTEVRANACHPGFVDTNLTRHRETNAVTRFVVWMMKKRSALDVHTGTLTQLFLAGDEGVERDDIRAAYYVPIAEPSELKGPVASLDLDSQASRLWELSEKLVGESFPSA